METLKRWREKVGALEGAEELSFSGSFETGGGFIVQIGARDHAGLGDAVQRFSAALMLLQCEEDIWERCISRDI